MQTLRTPMCRRGIGTSHLPRFNQKRSLRLIPRDLAKYHRDSLYDQIGSCVDSYHFVSRLLLEGQTLHEIQRGHSAAVGRYSEEYVRMRMARELVLFISNPTRVLHVKRNTYFDHEKIDLLLDTGYGDFLVPVQVKSSVKAQRVFQRKRISFISCVRPGEETPYDPYISIVARQLHMSGHPRMKTLFQGDWEYL